MLSLTTGLFWQLDPQDCKPQAYRRGEWHQHEGCAECVAEGEAGITQVCHTQLVPMTQLCLPEKNKKTIVHHL